MLQLDGGTPKDAEQCLVIIVVERLIMIGAKVVLHGKCVTFQLAEVAMLVVGEFLLSLQIALIS